MERQGLFHGFALVVGTLIIMAGGLVYRGFQRVAPRGRGGSLRDRLLASVVLTRV